MCIEWLSATTATAAPTIAANPMKTKEEEDDEETKQTKEIQNAFEYGQQCYELTRNG